MNSSVGCAMAPLSTGGAVARLYPTGISRQMARKPIIGLSISLYDFGDYGSVGFQRPVALAGGVPFALSRLDGSFLDEALDACDGILLGGGRDIEPHHFGQEATEHLAATEPHRDAFELDLVRRALDRKLPLLGACREGGGAPLARGRGEGPAPSTPSDSGRAGEPPARGARGRRDRGRQLPSPGARPGGAGPHGRGARSRRRG